MSKNIHVFTPEEVIEAIDSGAKNVIQIREKKANPKKKEYKVKYFDLYIKTKNFTGPAVFKIEDTNIVFGLRDPAYAPDDDDEGPRKLNICTSVTDSGVFGEMMSKLNPLFLAEVDRCVEEKMFIKSKRTVKEFVSAYYSEERADEKAGQERESPLINFRIDFSLYPSNHPRSFLRGQPKSLIYDYTNDYTDANGRTQYKLAKTPEGESLNDANAYTFITSGSTIKTGRIHMESLVVSQMWISVPTLAGKLIIDPADNGGFDDEGGFTDDTPDDSKSNGVSNGVSNGKKEANEGGEGGDNEGGEDGEGEEADGEDVDDFLNDV